MPTRPGLNGSERVVDLTLTPLTRPFVCLSAMTRHLLAAPFTRRGRRAGAPPYAPALPGREERALFSQRDSTRRRAR